MGAVVRYSYAPHLCRWRVIRQLLYAPSRSGRGLPRLRHEERPDGRDALVQGACAMTLNAARFFPEGIRRWAVTHVGLALFLILSLTLNGLLIWRALYWQHRAQD